MDFNESILALSKTCKSLCEKVRGNEEATKHALIMPFIEALGYNPFNINEVFPEYDAAIGTYKDQKVDYAILKDEKPIIIIECKAYGEPLDAKKCSQLLNYFVGVEPKIGILTDGCTYQFFTRESEESSKMDTRPYLVLNLEKPDALLINELKKICKDTFDPDEVLNAADELRYNRDFKFILSEQLQGPDEDFLRFFLKHKISTGEICYSGALTQKALNRFKPILAKSLNQFIQSEVNRRLQDALNQTDPAKVDPPETKEEETETNDSGIVTTEDEIAVHYVLMSIAGELCAPEKIVMKDYKGFCNFYFEKSNKQLLKIFFNKKPYFVTVFDDPDVKIPVDSPTDVYKLKDRILELIKKYLQ